jgi:NADPH2:quinone reductase
MGRPDLFGPSLEEVLGWIASGEIKLNIGAHYPLEKAQEAHDALEGRQTTGKIILNP